MNAKRNHLYRYFRESPDLNEKQGERTSSDIQTMKAKVLKTMQYVRDE